MWYMLLGRVHRWPLLLVLLQCLTVLMNPHAVLPYISVWFQLGVALVPATGWLPVYEGALSFRRHLWLSLRAFLFWPPIVIHYLRGKE